MTKTWMITGVSGGLGREIARAALARGDVVVGTVRKPEAVAAFEALAPGRAHGVVMDVTDTAAVTAAVARAEAVTGAIDVLVNNAGYGLVGAVEEASLDEVRAQFETNVFGPLAVLKAALPAMRARRAGRIINITSVSGLAVWAGTGVYCASKWALEGMNKAMALDLAPHGIRSNTIAPTFIETPLTKPFFEDNAFKASVLSKIKLGRIGQVEDLMGAVLFLASDASALMTGTSLVVDGGWTAE